ncbi:MAG: single-stranded DNA-binding protein, partial [Solirubrobacteraceae bacterium]
MSFDITPTTTFTGRLTADAELRQVGEDRQVCKLRVAYSQRSEKQPTGYIDVEAWGAQATPCAALT